MNLTGKHYGIILFGLATAILHLSLFSKNGCRSHQKQFGSLGVIAGRTGRARHKILIAENDPQDKSEHGITHQCPPDQIPPLLKKGDGQKIGTQQCKVAQTI